MTILALDVGSSSVRALLFDHDDKGVKLIPDAITQHNYVFDTTEPRQSTVDAVFLRSLLEKCIDEILQHPQAQDIQAVGMDTFVGNLVVVDGDNTPLASVVTYADTRSAQFIPSLKQRIDADYMHQRTGTILHTAYWPAQIELFEYPSPVEPFLLGYLDFATYVLRSWFNKHVPMGYSTASWSGLLHRESLDWDADWLEVLSVPKMLMPPLADYTSAQNGLSEEYVKRWPQLADVPFYLAVGDGASAQVGSGAVEDGTAALTIGTTAAIRKVSTEKLPPVPAGCWGYRIDADHHLIGGALSEGGSIFAWARDVLKLDLDTLESELSKSEPAQHGLTVLPLLAGERSPGWRGDATGTIHGLRLSTTPFDVVHALLESVALRLAIVARQLHLGGEGKIIGSGGASAKSPVWAQIIADAMEHPLHLIDEPEITALGTAHLAWCALNNQPVSSANPKIARIVEPRPQYAKVMRELIEKQQRLYHQLYH